MPGSVPLSPPAHRVPAWAAWLLVIQGKERGVCQKQVIKNKPVCRATWGNLVLLWGHEEQSPAVCAQNLVSAGTSSGSPALPFAPDGRRGGE